MSRPRSPFETWPGIIPAVSLGSLDRQLVRREFSKLQTGSSASRLSLGCRPANHNHVLRIDHQYHFGLVSFSPSPSELLEYARMPLPLFSQQLHAPAFRPGAHARPSGRRSCRRPIARRIWPNSADAEPCLRGCSGNGTRRLPASARPSPPCRRACPRAGRVPDRDLADLREAVGVGGLRIAD
jgi:hypothetical protein